MQKARTQGKTTQDLSQVTTTPSPIWVGRSNGDKSFGAIFEDDGKGGFFYLCSLNPQEILACVEIYQTADLPYPMRKEYVQIYWAEHGQRAALCVRGWPIAGF